MKVIDAYGVSQFSSSSSLTSRRCLLWHTRPWWVLIVAYWVICFPIAVKSRLCLDDVHVSRHSDFGSSVYGRQSVEGYYGPVDVCPCSGSFFFHSTLVDFLDEEDDVRAPSVEFSKGFDQTARNSLFKMTNGETVSCSLKNWASGIPLQQGFGNRSVSVERVDFCKGSYVSSSAPRNVLDEHLEEEEAEILISSSSFPEIEISPPILDWGTKNIYSPSLAILKMVNRNNGIVLSVYDLFSTNTQFNAYSFQKLVLASGESASIPFIFLPTRLGLSTAQLVLQTSFGGFIIHAIGKATMSPYHLQPFVGFNISTGKRFSGNLTLYNPSNDVLYVEEVATWISISGSNKNHSAHVFCSANRFQQCDIQSDSHIDSEGFSLRNGELGSSRLDIRPHQQWEVPPTSTKAIIELNLWPHLARKVSGAICMKLGNSSQENSETIILPIDIEVRERESYTDLSGSVSLYFDIIIPCHGGNTVFSISLRNDASYLLHVVKISEETKTSKFFEIRYVEGLLLFPGTVTQIALITFSPALDSQDNVAENHSTGLKCMLNIRTNDSVNPDISIPCHDLLLNSCKYQHGFHTFESEGSYINLVSKHEVHEDEKCASTRTGSLGNANEESSPFKASEVIESDDLVLNNWRSQATMSMMSVLEQQELMFPVVQVGSHYSKWISVHNPSQKPVVMQLVLNSGAIIDRCKSSDDLSEHTFLTKFSHIDSAEIRVGFSVAESAVTEAFVHPLGSALFGPVIFRPSNRCMWRSSALIRNNLSGVECLPIQAFGGSQSLVILEGSVPILKLDFDLHFLMTFNVSASDTLFPIERSTAFCSNLFSKELFAKNTGEIPLEIIKLKVSGTDCGSDGFTIHNCKGFSLAPGESTNLLISYQADCSTAAVHRDLELAMDTGILVIPMKASVPVYMLNMCRKALFKSMHWKLILLVLFASFTILLHFMFRIIPQAFSPSNEDHFFKFSSTVGFPSKTEASSPPHQNTRNSRSSKENEKFEAAIFNRYPECTDVHHNSPRKKLDKECFDHQKNGSLSPQSAINLMEVANNTQTLEMPQNCNLTVRVPREKGRRRKKRLSGAGLAAKLDVSSSQSGNSTPSSPLSPNISTPKHLLTQSPHAADHPRAEESKEHNNKKRHGCKVSNQAVKAESAKCSGSKRFTSDQGLPSVTTKFTGKSSLLPSATFPGTGWRSPGEAASSFLASTSPIAPCSRAPGSKLCEGKTIEGEGNDASLQDFTYDIWGNHFSEHIFCRPKESTSKLSDASEGDSHSFFTRDPQSPMMMSLARSVSPTLEFSPDVNCS